MRWKDLVPLLTRHRVDIVAVDNVTELASDWSDLLAFLSLFEEPPRLVEVTRIEGRTYSLESIARSLGLLHGHPTPDKAAEIACKLAYMGIGSELLVYEEETHVIVRRSKLPVQGGMSRERFRRNIELAVLDETKKLREKLNRAGLDYDAFIERGEYGLKGAAFIVYAPYANVKRLVKSKRGPGYIVKVKPVIREKIEYVPLTGRSRKREVPRKYLVVGVDPGVRTGLALLDLTGRLILLASYRWFGRGQIIREVSKHGIAAIVATDVNPPPEFVRKLATALNAALYVPPRSLTVEEKRTLTQGVKTRDSHQRDALAAAIKALRHYQAKFLQLEKRIEELSLPLPREEAKYLLTKGLAVNEVIRRLAEKYLLGRDTIFVKEEKTGVSVSDLLSYVRRLEERLIELKITEQRLNMEKENLAEKVRELEETLNRVLSLQRAETLKAKAVRTLEHRIELMAKENEELKQSLRRKEEKIKLLKKALDLALNKPIVWGYVIDKLSLDSLEQLPLSAYSKPLLVLNSAYFNPSALEKLKAINPVALILPSPTEKLVKQLVSIGIVPIDSEELESLVVIDNELFIVDRSEYLKALESEKRRVETEHKEAVKQAVLSLIKSYREDRARAFRRPAAGSR